MPIEIERKFLVVERRVALPAWGRRIEQGYLTIDDPVVRVRLLDGRGMLAIKSQQLPSGTKLEGLAAEIARSEFEYEIPASDAAQLMELCSWRLVKMRHNYDSGLEHDVYEGALAGLEVIEFESEDACSPPPPPEGITWREVTSDPRFYNVRLALEGLPGETVRVRV